MNIRRMLAAGTVSFALIGTALSIAQEPHNIDPRKNPNLAAAQQHVDQALQKIDDAQRANEHDMAGHAKRAKELLDQANVELKRAAESRDHEHK
jgi:hypothetical protein